MPSNTLTLAVTPASNLESDALAIFQDRNFIVTPNEDATTLSIIEQLTEFAKRTELVLF